MAAPDRLAGYDQVGWREFIRFLRPRPGGKSEGEYPIATSPSIDSVGRSDDSASPDPDLKKLSRAMSHSLPSLDIDAGGSITDTEGSTIEASHVLKKYEDEFFRVTDAKFKLHELKRKGVISDDLVMKIESTNDGKARELLFEHLHRHANVTKLREYCRIAISADGYPKMQDLGEKMLHNLPPEGAGQTCGQASSQAGAQDRETIAIIPDIADEYVKIKDMFVSVCSRKGSPTLEEVKDHCIDLIQCVKRIPPRITRLEDDIEKAKTFTELARIVCFQLSKWLSYEFFKKVVTHFHPALRSVKQRLMRYENKLKPLLLQKLEDIAEKQSREEVPRTMAELVVKYRLNADGFFVEDLIAERDFLAQRLDIPEQLLQVLSWGEGSIVVTYWIVRDLLPLAELALCRQNVRAELTRHGVEEIYLGSHPSGHPGPVDQSLQTLHMQRRTIVTVLDAHRQDLDVTSLTSELKDRGVLTAEQCHKLASLDDKEKRHEALLYTLLAHDGPDTFHKLVECMGLRDSSTAADLQATFKRLVESPGVLSIISSSPCTPESPVERAVSHIVEAMSGEVPPQQTEQGEPTRGVAQPHLKEERSAGELEEGEPRQDKASRLRRDWAPIRRSMSALARNSASARAPIERSRYSAYARPLTSRYARPLRRPLPELRRDWIWALPLRERSASDSALALASRWDWDSALDWARDWRSCPIERSDWAPIERSRLASASASRLASDSALDLALALMEDPEEPEVTEDPEEPDVTGDPEKPEVTEDPEKPEVTQDPEKPEVTEDPEKPEVTEDPEESEVTED